MKSEREPFYYLNNLLNPQLVVQRYKLSLMGESSKKNQKRKPNSRLTPRLTMKKVSRKPCNC